LLWMTADVPGIKKTLQGFAPPIRMREEPIRAVMTVPDLKMKKAEELPCASRVAEPVISSVVE